jgi:hypothetical protein
LIRFAFVQLLHLFGEIAPSFGERTKLRFYARITYCVGVPFAFVGIGAESIGLGLGHGPSQLPAPPEMELYDGTFVPTVGFFPYMWRQ